MALGTISFTQYPILDTETRPVITNWTPIIPYAVKQTNITDLFYFKFILEIRLTDATGTLLGKLKQKKSPSSTSTTNVAAVFDVRDIVNTQLETQVFDFNVVKSSIHTLGSNLATKPYSQNTTQLIAIYVKAYQEYSESATASPAEVTSTSVNDTLFYIPASLDLNTTRGTTYLQTDAFETFKLKGSDKRLLSDVQSGYNSIGDVTGYVNVIRTTDYHTVGFLNGKDDFDSEAKHFKIRYYNSAGVNMTNSAGATSVDITNSNANGGANPETSSEVNTNSERLIYFGCGPANLEAQSVNTQARPSDSGYSGWAYYTIQPIKSGGDAMGATYYFVLDDDNCKGYDIRRLGWINSVGCWDYFNFKKKSTQTLKVERDNYEVMLGDYSSATYSYNNFDGGKKTRKTTAMISETLNTDWISELDAVLLENLMKSTNVQIIQNDFTTYTVPVMIKDTSFVKKTTANDGIKIQYTIQIEYANPENTNS